ncbi:MAG: amino acid adenylation domain-containing protein [Prevotella sp.]|nr:amino acid adenylation domain-containing protein [Prevotella sp.]
MKTYPLTFSQLGVLMACRQQPGSTAYQLPCAIPFPKTVDAERLVKALEVVVANRAVLHTRLVVAPDGEPRQFSDDCLHIEVHHSTMTENEALQYIYQGFIRPFSLFGTQPLCRFEVVATEAHHWLLMDFHHIIADGMTLTQCLMGRDLPTAYEGRELVPDVTALYELAEEQQKKENNGYAKAKEYYRQLFQDATFTTLPRVRSGVPSESRTVCHRMPRAEMDAWCEQHQVSANMLLMAAFCITLSKFSHQQRVAFVTLTHGRSGRRQRQAYGMFVRTMPVAVEVEGVVMDFIRNLRPLLTDAVRHADYPYVHFCRDLHQSAAVSFAFQGPDIMEQVSVGGYGASGLQLHKDAADSDLGCVVYATDHEYEWRVEAVGRPKEELQLFLRCMETCLHGMMQHPEGRVDELETMGKAEKEAVLALSRGERVDDDGRTVVALFHEQATRTPQAVAVTDGSVKMTYSQLNRRSVAVARWLAAKGVGQGDRVGLWAEPGCWFLAAALAIMRTGAAYMPLDPQWPEAYRKGVVEEACLKEIIYPDSIPDDDECDEDVLLDASTPDGIAYVIFTSGSTGGPKGVMISHRALTNLLHFIVRRWRLNKDSRISCHSSLAFDASVEDLFPVLTVGGMVCLMPTEVRHDLERMHRFIDDNAVTGGCYTTQLGGKVAACPHPTLDYVCLGGERMTFAPQAACRIINTYGPTEFCVNATWHELLPGRAYTTIPIGRPVDNIDAFVTDLHGRLLPRGAVGELCLAGVQMAAGYWHAPDLTAQKFTKCDFTDRLVYHTGDLVWWNEEGLLEYVGRKDFMVKVNGFRVCLEEVERAVARLPGIEEVCVAEVNVSGRSRLCAYYVAEKLLDSKVLQRCMRKCCPTYMIPSLWMRLEQMPLLYNGKVDRRRLSLPVPASQPVAEAHNRRQQVICEAFARVLDVERVGLDDDFFDMGGSSLTAMSLVAELREAGCKVEYGWVFQHPTPRLLERQLATEGMDGFYHVDADSPDIHRFLMEKRQTFSYGKPTLGGTVLLTGATGFLGMHVLHAILTSCRAKVVCLVRAASDMEAMKRLTETHSLYFGQPLSEDDFKRVDVIPGDLTDPDGSAVWRQADAALVINCAADVRHFAKLEELGRVNTEAVGALVALCRDTNARLVQVSTLSVAGLYNASEGEGVCLTENDLLMGQYFAEPYSYTKLMAEKLVLEEMARGRLKGCVVRVGRLSPRSNDAGWYGLGERDALAMSLALYEQMGVMPASVASLRIGLLPVDVAARSIVRLAALDGGAAVWHVDNPQYVSVREMMAKKGKVVEVVSDEVFLDRLEHHFDGMPMERSGLHTAAFLSVHGRWLPNTTDCSFTNEVLKSFL